MPKLIKAELNRGNLKYSTNVFWHDVVSFAEELLIFPEQPIILLLLVALYFLVVSIMNTWFGSLA